MKRNTYEGRVALGALLALGLAACGGESSKDEPTAEMIAGATQAAYADLMPPQLGRRVEVTQWDKLTYSCTDAGGNVKRVDCVTGGKIWILGYQNGVELQGGGAESDPPWDFTFEKRAEGWVAVDYRQKAN